jgi:hypothetical protein
MLLGPDRRDIGHPAATDPTANGKGPRLHPPDDPDARQASPAGHSWLTPAGVGVVRASIATVGRVHPIMVDSG